MSEQSPQRPVAVGYVRVSTAEQALEGVSVEAQRASLTRYCEMQGLDLVRIYEDPGVSASKPLGIRPSGREMLADLQGAAEGTVLVTLKLDRCFRNAQDCLATVGQLEDQGIALTSVREQIDTSTAMGRFFLTLMAAVAEMELAIIRERTQYALDHLKAQGKRTGTVPYGWRVWEGDGATLEEDEHEQSVLRRIMRLREEGMSYQAIADWLNAKSITKRGGTRWHKTTVFRLVQREGGAGGRGGPGNA